MEKLLSNPLTAFEFIVSGNSTVTLKSTKTEKHFTYKVKRAKDKNIRFVSVLFGNNNDSDYKYIGCIFENGLFKHTKRSNCSNNTTSFQSFRWAWEHIRRMNIPKFLEIWHEGKCGRCGRKLTDPKSIEIGLGPICRNL